MSEREMDAVVLAISGATLVSTHLHYERHGARAYVLGLLTAARSLVGEEGMDWVELTDWLEGFHSRNLEPAEAKLEGGGITLEGLQSTIREAEKLIQETGLQLVDHSMEGPRRKKILPRAPHETVTDENVKWSHLCGLCPRLRMLSEAISRMHVPKGERFCANRLWYGVFKPQLCELVGWGSGYAETHALGSMAGYDTAYQQCYDLLPPCVDCGE